MPVPVLLTHADGHLTPRADWTRLARGMEGAVAASPEAAAAVIVAEAVAASG
jgi:hypothetical protein